MNWTLSFCEGSKNKLESANYYGKVKILCIQCLHKKLNVSTVSLVFEEKNYRNSFKKSSGMAP